MIFHFFLNGWRRIGVVLCSLWILALLGFLYYECELGQPILLTDEMVTPVIMKVPNLLRLEQSMPSTEKEKILASKMAAAAEHNEQRSRELGRKLEPWEMEWVLKNEPEIVEKLVYNRTTSINYTTLAFLMLAVPIFSWLTIEIFVKIFAWVMLGFKSRRHT